MQFHETKIPGVWVLEAEPFRDERGVFRRHFCAEEFAAHGLDAKVAQGNVSENFHRHTLRGFHYQEPPHQEAKTVSCIRGAFHAIVADIRPHSATYLHWMAEEITAENRRGIYVPPGCAMAMLTLEDDTILHYYMSAPFESQSYRGFRYDDPAFGFVWPAEPCFLSDKDRSYPDFQPVAR